MHIRVSKKIMRFCRLALARRMLKLLVGLTIVLLLPALSSAEANNAAIEVDCHDNQLSLNAGQVGLEAVLVKIAERCDFDITVSGKLSGHPRSMSFTRLPLAQAFDKLVGEHSVIISPASASRSGRTLIYLFGDSNGTSSASRILGKTNSDEVSREPVEAISTDPAQQVQLSQRAAIPSPLPQQVSQPVTTLNHAGGGVDLLEQLLLNDPDPEIRLNAAYSLEAIGDPMSLSALERGLSDDSEAVRSAIVSALQTTDVSELPRWVDQVLRSDPSVGVRMQIIEMLESSPDSRAKALLQVATSDADADVREAATNALELFVSDALDPEQQF